MPNVFFFNLLGQRMITIMINLFNYINIFGRYFVRTIKEESSNESDICRICHCGRYDIDERLVCVCKCLGSIKYVHISCISEWILAKGSNNCEICQMDIMLDRRVYLKNVFKEEIVCFLFNLYLNASNNRRNLMNELCQNMISDPDEHALVTIEYAKHDAVCQIMQSSMRFLIHFYIFFFTLHLFFLIFNIFLRLMFCKYTRISIQFLFLIAFLYLSNPYYSPLRDPIIEMVFSYK